MKPQYRFRLLLTAALACIFLPAPTLFAQASAAWQADLESAEKFYLSGDDVQSKKLYEQALNEVPDDTARATVFNQMGVAQNQKHRFSDAQKSFSQAVELRKKVLGENDPATLQAMSNLALATYKSGDEVDAEKIYLDCIARKRKVSPKSESLAKSLTNLANLYTDERNCTEAKKCYLEAADVDSAIFGSNSAEAGVDLFNVGVMLQKCQQPSEALVYLDKAHAIFAALGDKYGQVRALHYSSLSHGDMKNYEKASQCSARALAMHEELKGKGHPDTIVHLLAAGDALFAASKYDEAEKLYLQALHNVRSSEHPNNVRLTECNLALAQLYKKENRLDDSEQYFKKALIHYEDLSKKEKRDLYELPLAYSQLLKELQQGEESEHLNHKYLHVYAPDRAR
ncbi:MAG: tetratricopeptide repeat protein [Cyanobacteria bacterium SZAS LIN-5]|nr:tetratricopeptide repeat protein [Cyanobacteria bacterium SZAS LIN-5]